MIEEANAMSSFNDDIVVGTIVGGDTEISAEDADQAIVVLSRSYLTGELTMRELKILLQHGKKILPVYYGVTPSELREISSIYDRQGMT